jgi:hypothetical protein
MPSAREAMPSEYPNLRRIMICMLLSIKGPHPLPGTFKPFPSFQNAVQPESQFASRKLRTHPAEHREAGQCLSYFGQLSAENQNSVLPSTIQHIFPPIFGEDAAIKTLLDTMSFTKSHGKSLPFENQMLSFAFAYRYLRSIDTHLSPKVILAPSSVQQVSKVLALCRFLGTISFIRGGGHLQNPGFCSNSGGTVICLSKFREVTVSEDRKIASVGAALTWFDVYRELDEYDIAVTGGRMPTVGVSGDLLGGDLSIHNSEHGLSCSGVVDYEVITAS